MDIALELLALSSLVLFMGFAFCDGFKLHTLRKLLWFAVFLAFAITVFKIRGKFALELILPIPMLFAFALCWHEKKRRRLP